MKKTSKILAVVLVAVLAVATLAIFAACGESGTVTGDCHYENAWSAGKYYGVKVDVTVSGGKITAVKLYSEEETGWTRTSADPWSTGLGHDKTEAAYEGWIEENIVGQKIATVLGWQAVADKGAQTVGKDVPHITGATQSSARIIVAVQNALCELKSVSLVTGEAKYENKWNAGSYYGAKVDVIVMGGKIINVRLYSEKETGWTRTSGTWTEGQNAGDLGFDKTEAAYASYLVDEIIGQKVKTVMSWEATATQDAQTVGEDVPHIAGATQSSARIIVAIQDALGKL